MEEVTGIAIIGIGRIGRVHASNILRIPKVQLLYIVDIDKRSAIDYIEQYSLTTTTPLHTDDLLTVYNDERVKAVVVCTPTKWHKDQVLESLQHGKAVMCEKPLAMSLDEIVDCYETASKNNRPLFCAFNKRFDPQLSSVHSQISDVVGKLKVVKAVARDHPRNSIDYLKISGGMLIDTCIHECDIIRWMTGMNPETIYVMSHAHFDDIREIGDKDQVFINMKFPDGTMALVDSCRETSYGHDQRVEVFGDKGMVISDNLRPIQSQIYSSSGSTIPSMYNSCITRYHESYFQEIKHFINVVKGNEKLKVIGSDTVWATLLCLAGSESISTGLPVNINEFVGKKFPRIPQILRDWQDDEFDRINAKK